MKNVTLSVWSLILALALVPAAQAQSAVADQIRKLEEELRQAAVKGDTAVFERILADDYRNVNARGLVRSKSDILADFKSGAAKTESLALENIQVKVYGDTAVLTADRTAKSTLKGQDTGGRQRQIRVYVKRNGRWQAVAMQTTPIR
jgi:uncharacterized protein (TIGR02246 family)